MEQKSTKKIVELFLKRSKNFSPNRSTKNNMLDPFSTLAIFMDLKSTGKKMPSFTEWQKSEIERQRQKNLMNAIGELNQDLIATLDGWKSYPPGSGMPDVIGRRGNQKIIAEIKNKHNTMNNSAKKATYDELINFLKRKEFKDHVAIVVYIVDKKFKNVFWKPYSVGKNRPAKNNLICMSGKVFYTIASDEKKRQPTVDFQSNEDLRKWKSWNTFDTIINNLLLEIEKVQKVKINDWIKKQFKDFLSIYN